MIPEHYSRDIAQRCQSLIRNLRPVVQQGLDGDVRFGGPLGTTFLLAMATPMIVLPIERLYKPAANAADQAGDDRQLDPNLAQEVVEVLGPARRFGGAPFVTAARWSYVAGWPPFNAGFVWPRELLDRLAQPDAQANADRAPARQILLDLRNALAHGGVAYLDANGQQSGGEAAMLAFAGAKFAHRPRRLESFNILRIREDHFCDFLVAWADWLAQPRIRDAINNQDPLAA